MRIFISFFVCAALLLAALVSVSPTARAQQAEAIEIRAASAVLYEKNSGQFLYDKDALETFPPGSLAKVMTLLLAVEAVGRGEVRLHQNVTVSQKALSYLTDQSLRHYQEGERVRFSDLLYAAYIGSESEACYIIAETVGGTVPEFVSHMNARARALGCTDTLFSDPAGEGNGEQYTTARDQVVIFSAAVENSLFLSIAQTTTYRAAATNLSPERTIVNSNLALRPGTAYYYPGLYAGKTDSSPDNGYSFISAAQAGSLHLFAAVIGAQAVREGGTVLAESYTETARLYDWAVSSFSWRNVTMEHKSVATMPVRYGLGRGTVDLSPAETVRLLLPNSVTDEDITYTIALQARSGDEALTAPVSRGEVLGSMTVSIPGQPEFKVPLIAEQSVEMDRKTFFKDELRKALTNKWVIIGGLGLILLAGGYVYIVVMARRTQYENELRLRQTRQMRYEAYRQELLASRRLDEDTHRYKPLSRSLKAPEEDRPPEPESGVSPPGGAEEAPQGPIRLAPILRLPTDSPPERGPGKAPPGVPGADRPAPFKADRPGGKAVPEDDLSRLRDLETDKKEF